MTRVEGDISWASATRTPRGVERGSVLDGKYRIDRFLGEGAMGVVFAATHLGLDEVVAVKFIHPRAGLDSSLEGRFAREAKVSARIQSEHIARVLDVGVAEQAGPYMVMEYVDGRSLGDMLDEGGPLAPRAAAGFVLQACSALAAAHAHGIVHRDVKPGNLMLTVVDGRELIKLLDFGAAKATLSGVVLGRDLANLRQTMGAIGTPLYMAPEQLRAGASVDARADIWSLGTVLYELLTADTAFHGEGISDSILRVIEGPLPRLPEDFGAEREALQAVIEGCLQRDRDRRYGSAAQLAEALAAVPLPPAGSSPKGSALTLLSAPPQTGSGERAAGSNKPRARRRAAWAALLFAGLGGIWVLMPRAQAPAPSGRSLPLVAMAEANGEASPPTAQGSLSVGGAKSEAAPSGGQRLEPPAPAPRAAGFGEPDAGLPERQSAEEGVASAPVRAQTAALETPSTQKRARHPARGKRRKPRKPARRRVARPAGAEQKPRRAGSLPAEERPLLVPHRQRLPIVIPPKSEVR